MFKSRNSQQLIFSNSKHPQAWFNSTDSAKSTVLTLLMCVNVHTPMTIHQHKASFPKQVQSIYDFWLSIYTKQVVATRICHIQLFSYNQLVSLNPVQLSPLVTLRQHYTCAISLSKYQFKFHEWRTFISNFFYFFRDWSLLFTICSRCITELKSTHVTQQVLRTFIKVNDFLARK